MLVNITNGEANPESPNGKALEQKYSSESPVKVKKKTNQNPHSEKSLSDSTDQFIMHP